MMFAWSNSYNKQMRFKCGIGAIHSVNNTSLVCGDMGSWARKHTGSADTETKETIEQQVKLAKVYYEQLCSDKESMKKINLDVRKQAQILGMLFAEHDILTTEQASMIKQQMSRPTYKCSEPGTLWEFYNFVTIALQQSHPKTWMEDQRVLHWFISDTFKFNKVDVTETATEIIEDAVAQIESEEETVDPAQVDLEDSIAEIEAEQNTTIEEQRAEYWDQQTRIEEGLDHKGGDDDDDDEPVDDSPEITGIPDGDKLSDTDDEDQIAERIKEDEAAVAKVCDEVTDAEAAELIKGQKAVDQQMAQEAAAEQPEEDLGEADFDLALASDDDEDDVESGDIDFDFA
jgi:hypothetical protein